MKKYIAKKLCVHTILQIRSSVYCQLLYHEGQRFQYSVDSTEYNMCFEKASVCRDIIDIINNALNEFRNKDEGEYNLYD